MHIKARNLIISLALIITFISISGFLYKRVNSKLAVIIPSLMSPTPTPFNPFPYHIPQIKNDQSYRILIVGDSMVSSLGPNAQLLRQHLIERYPGKEFVTYNYGFPATSIETLPKRLNEETIDQGQKFPPILSQGVDLIIVESFALNPLSQLAPGEGLKKHREILDESIRKIISKSPNTVVAIMATIAPNRDYFAKGVYDLSLKERRQWADERIEYFKSTIDYARENNIPLINVFEKSLTKNGDGNLNYISKKDYIHPSPEGVDFISKTTADFIYENNIFPG